MRAGEAHALSCELAARSPASFHVPWEVARSVGGHENAPAFAMPGRIERRLLRSMPPQKKPSFLAE
jgi:hypothetical protein